MITTSVQDPDIYSVANRTDKRDVALLRVFLKVASTRHVTVLDDEGKIRNALKVNLPHLGPQEAILLSACLDRSEKLPVSEAASNELRDASAMMADSDECPRGSRLAAFALAADAGVDTVVTSEQDYEALQVLSVRPGFTSKMHSLCDYVDAATVSDQPSFGSVLGLSREELFDRVFAPLLRWAKSVIIVDKQLGAAFNKGDNWGSFQTSLLRIHRSWKAERMGRKTASLEIVTYPPRVDGKMMEASREFAREIWMALGEKPDLHIRVVRPNQEERQALGREGMDDIAHDRYLITMPHGFVVNVTRGFDLLTEGNDFVRRAASVGLYGRQPKDLEAMLRLRKTAGCVHPEVPS